MTSELIVRREGRAGRITLNRPAALNALTLAMVRGIRDALTAWSDDPAVALVLLDGAGERGLCAGGDVRWLYEQRSEGSGAARTFWAEEYRLNAFIASYPKPFVAIQDGIVMGGGIGLSAHASHRVVTERSRLAMPETTIGLIPDVGGTWLLSRAPGETGTYLGLTGAHMGASDAIYAGFAGLFVRSDRLSDLTAALVSEPVSVNAIVERYASEPPQSPLAKRRREIDRCFAGDDMAAIMAALARQGEEWSTRALADLEGKSPRALVATLAALRHVRSLSCLEEALDVEYRLCVRLYEDGEFPEGIRALIVDKDRKPRWRPVSLEDVERAGVAAYLAPLPDGEELGLGAARFEHGPK
jgi:enoyl-CoA hydratase